MTGSSTGRQRLAARCLASPGGHPSVDSPNVRRAPNVGNVQNPANHCGENLVSGKVANSL